MKGDFTAASPARPDLDRQIAEIFADAGCSGWIHAVALAPHPVDYGYDPDTPVVLASVYKVVVLTSLCRAADAGAIDLRETVRVDPRDWAVGPTGIAALHDPVIMSWRDLATSMMTVSDNAAADVILDRVGLERVLSDLDDLGLAETRIVGGVAELHALLRRETGTSTVEEAFAAITDPDVGAESSAYDVAFSSSSTPRDATSLLRSIWRDEAASPQSCSFIRATMHKQVFGHRLASGFSLRGVRVAGKTGTVGAIRNEIGVVEFPGEYPVAVAVFTKSARAELSLPGVDRAIGLAGRAAVSELRTPCA